jgi:multidrug efflux pump subunit AcrB
MWRENRNYAITVQSDMKEGVQGATVTAEAAAESSRRLAQAMGVRVTASRWRARWRKQQGLVSIAAGVP